MTIAQYLPMNSLGKGVCRQCNRPSSRLYLQFFCKSTSSSLTVMRCYLILPPGHLSVWWRGSDATHSKAAGKTVRAVGPCSAIVDEGLTDNLRHVVKPHAHQWPPRLRGCRIG